MDTTDRKDDVIITGGDTVTNSRVGGGRASREKEENDSSNSQTHSQLQLNRKTAVISINCTEVWNPV